MKRYLGNAFSLNMVKPEDLPHVRFMACTLEEVKDWLSTYEWESCVGHADTANVISKLLEIDVPQNRTSVTLEMDDCMIVAQYKGPRLEEGATTLPEGAEIQWVYVELE
tara:strand:- start:5493 stop:5819 length:327 start_codon:yes stop_codon:yes gene_type:complete